MHFPLETIDLYSLSYISYHLRIYLNLNQMLNSVHCIRYPLLSTELINTITPEKFETRASLSDHISIRNNTILSSSYDSQYDIRL